MNRNELKCYVDVVQEKCSNNKYYALTFIYINIYIYIYIYLLKIQFMLANCNNSY